MANERQGAGQPQAPANPIEESFGINDDDFYVDPETGAVFIGDTNVEGRGKRLEPTPPTPPPPVQGHRTNVEMGEETFGTREEDFEMDDRGNISIGNVRVKEEGIDNTDHAEEEFKRGRMTADEIDAEREAAEEKLAASQKKPPPEPTQEEYALKILDQEYIVKDKNELLNLAQKGLRADQKFQEIAEMRKEIEPFYQISLRLKDDPAFVAHVKNFGQPNYEVDGPEPVLVQPDQFSKIVEERVSNQVQAQRIYWSHDEKYKEFKDYPKSDEVRQKLLADSLHWDKFTRDWVDKNPVAYADKFQQTSQKLIRERMLDPNPARPIPPRVIEKQKAVLEQLRAKEIAKEKAKVESARSNTEVQAQDGRLALNRARKRAAETGSVADWADVIEKMGFAD
jgi:hypothetical protein